MPTSEIQAMTAKILDIRPLQPTNSAKICCKVVFFRDQKLPPETPACFAPQFGPLWAAL